MRTCHALEHAMLQCTEGLRSGCSLRLTVQCVPQDEMCRSRGVGMTKFKKERRPSLSASFLVVGGNIHGTREAGRGVTHRT